MTFFSVDPALDQTLRQILSLTWEVFPSLAQNQIAVTWIVYDPPYIANTGGGLSAEEFWKHVPRGASYRGVERIYPASVVKLFYLVAVHEWLEQGMINASDELERALTDMIVVSSNDATSLVVDILSGTTSGPELPTGPFQTWQYQRNIVNRYLQSLGWPELATINVNQKTWGDGPYGRERVFVGELYENRNMLTTEATARLIHSIVGGVAVSAPRSQSMMNLMQRPLTANSQPGQDEDQVTGFIGAGLPPQAHLYSKAGFTSKVRHDAAYVELPDQRPFMLVVFLDSKEHSQNRALLPFISEQIVEAVMAIN